MTSHGYPASAMLGDYLRAAAGFLPATTMLATMPLGATAGAVLGVVAALFASFGIRTMLRHGSRVELTESAMRSTGLLQTSIVWEELDRMRLGYYSTRRDRSEGWMQLELRSGRSRIRVDSRIEGFSNLVKRSAAAAERRGVQLDGATLANLAMFGVSLRRDGFFQEVST